MENAVGFLLIPAPSWWGSQEGERPFLAPLPPPFIHTPELTQMGCGRQVDPGGGGAGEAPGGARGPGQFYRSPHTEQTEFLLSPCS